MSLSNYKFIKKIGQGSYGEVWLVDKESSKKVYVLKKISFANATEKDKTSARLECELLQKLIHPNIVQYHDSFEENNTLYIAMAYCEGGDLYTHLKEQKGKHLLEKQITEWFIQIVMALQYMHKINILHRDLKTQNIFLARKAVIKVGDLGIAKQLQHKNDMASTLIGTPYYMSPELFGKKPYNFKSDIWSLGCITYEMATLRHAFTAKDYVALGYKIMQGQLPNMPSMYSRDLIVLMESMLNTKPDKRPSAKKILQEPYIQQHIKNFIRNAKCEPHIRGRRPDSLENISRNARPSPSRNNAEKLPNKFVPDFEHSCHEHRGSSEKLNIHDDDNDVVCHHVSKHCPANCPAKKSKNRPSSGQTILEKEIEKIGIVSEIKKLPEAGIKHCKSSPQIDRKQDKSEQHHDYSKFGEKRSSLDSKDDIPKSSTNSPKIGGRDNSNVRNSDNSKADEMKSARSRRRDKNRILGLKTMLFSPDVVDSMSNDSDKSDSTDNVNDKEIKKGRARNRRGHSLEEEIVILPELRRRSNNDTLFNAEDSAIDELVQVVEKMNETLSFVCNPKFMAVKDSIAFAHFRPNGSEMESSVEDDGPEENCAYYYTLFGLPLIDTIRRRNTPTDED